MQADHNSSAGLFLISPGSLEEGLRDSGVDVTDLARALASSPLWRDMPRAALLVRRSPRPAIGVVGQFDAASEKRLAALGDQITRSLGGLRYVSYAQAEQDCERLAERLIERFGREELRRFRFTAIPRGGFIVLGMLAYALGLDQSQLEPPRTPGAPLVVVDDCALTGSRFGRFLERCESREFIFAHLYSHPDLREAIEISEPGVLACLAAGDLADHAPERLGAEYDAWRRRCLARGYGHRYWVGQLDHVAFPWNEPDAAFWNPVTETMERGVNLVPPEMCLKNRTIPSTESVQPRVRVQPECPGPLRPSERVIFGDFEGQTVVGDLETGESFSLSGVAADLWRAIAERGSLEDAIDSLASEYDVDTAILRDDLRGFVEDLLLRGLLENAEASVAVC